MCPSTLMCMSFCSFYASLNLICDVNDKLNYFSFVQQLCVVGSNQSSPFPLNVSNQQQVCLKIVHWNLTSVLIPVN